MMRNNYHAGFTRKFDGLGMMLSIDPPYTTVRRSWSFNLKLGWFVFWYVKEKRRKMPEKLFPPSKLKPWGGDPLNTSKI